MEQLGDLVTSKLSTSSTLHHHINFPQPPHITGAKMSTSPPLPNTPNDANTAGIPDSEFQDNDLPLTLASSMILTSLPRDAASALRAAGDFPTPKITVRFVAIGSAPTLRQKVCRISSLQRFEQVVSYLRRTLKVGAMDSVFLYVNSSFAPALDEIVGNLHRVGDLFIAELFAKVLTFVVGSASRIPTTSFLSVIR